MTISSSSSSCKTSDKGKDMTASRYGRGVYRRYEGEHSQMQTTSGRGQSGHYPEPCEGAGKRESRSQVQQPRGQKVEKGWVDKMAG